MAFLWSAWWMHERHTVSTSSTEKGEKAWFFCPCCLFPSRCWGEEMLVAELWKPCTNPSLTWKWVWCKGSSSAWTSREVLEARRWNDEFWGVLLLPPKEDLMLAHMDCCDPWAKPTWAWAIGSCAGCVCAPLGPLLHEDRLWTCDTCHHLLCLLSVLLRGLQADLEAGDTELAGWLAFSFLTRICCGLGYFLAPAERVRALSTVSVSSLLGGLLAF